MSSANGRACLADGFAYGRWQHVRGFQDGDALRARNELLECGPQRCTNASHPGVCTSWEFANATCGPALSEARLCRALRCRSMLLVGDSTIGRLHAALAIYSGRSWLRTPPRYVAGTDFVCPSTPPQIYELCANRSTKCPSGVNVSFWRNDHLLRVADAELNRSLPGAEAAAACDWWRNTSIRHRYGDILILSRGAHVMEYTPELRSARAFHASRADELAESVLRPHLAPPHRERAAVILHAHWGALHATRAEHGPLASPEPARPMWHWDLLPMISEIEVQRLRAALPQADARGRAASGAHTPATSIAASHDHLGSSSSGHQRHESTVDGGSHSSGGALVVVDPTRALSLRQDCRDNHLHVVSALYLATTWRMVQNALGSIQ